MEPENEMQREEREAFLKIGAEALGLTCVGSIVVAPLARPVAVDASCADLSNLAASLMYLAHKQGLEEGRAEMRDDLRRLLGAT